MSPWDFFYLFCIRYHDRGSNYDIRINNYFELFCGTQIYTSPFRNHNTGSKCPPNLLLEKILDIDVFLAFSKFFSLQRGGEGDVLRPMNQLRAAGTGSQEIHILTSYQFPCSRI